MPASVSGRTTLPGCSGSLEYDEMDPMRAVGHIDDLPTDRGKRIEIGTK